MNNLPSGNREKCWRQNQHFSPGLFTTVQCSKKLNENNLQWKEKVTTLAQTPLLLGARHCLQQIGLHMVLFRGDCLGFLTSICYLFFSTPARYDSFLLCYQTVIWQLAYNTTCSPGMGANMPNQGCQLTDVWLIWCRVPRKHSSDHVANHACSYVCFTLGLWLPG